MQPTATEIVCYLILFSLGVWKLFELLPKACDWVFHFIVRLVEGPQPDRAIFLQAEKLYDTLKFINTPHVKEDHSIVAKSSEQCVGAARVAMAEFEAFKKRKTK